MTHILIFLASILYLCSTTYSQLPEKYVVLVIIDGARYSETLGDTSGRFIPNMKRLSAEAVVIDSFFNNGTTVTNRGVPAIWSGSWAVPKDTFYNGFNTQYAIVPSLWEYFRKHYGQYAPDTQAMYIMKYLSTPWLQSFYPQYGTAYWPWYILQGTSDISVWQNAKTKLQTYHPRLSVVYLADVDHYGHSGNWNDYTKSIKTADSIVNMMWDFVQTDTIFKDKTTILVTNDHGRHSDGVSTGFVSHGDGCAGCRRIMFWGIGADVKKGVHTTVRRNIPDIVPTIGAMLNFPTPLVSGNSIPEILSPTTKVEEGLAPNEFMLYQNYPNPFNPETVIRFRLPVTGFISLKVYDVLGKEVAVLLNEEKEAGVHTIEFSGRNLSSGIYTYRLSMGSSPLTKKMILLR
jgi:hypothetical protein